MTDQPFDFSAPSRPRRARPSYWQGVRRDLIRAALVVGLARACLFVTQPFWAPEADRFNVWRDEGEGRAYPRFKQGAVALFIPVALYLLIRPVKSRSRGARKAL